MFSIVKYVLWLAWILSLRRSRTGNHDLNFAAVAVVRVVEEDVDVADHANGPSRVLVLIAGPYSILRRA